MSENVTFTANHFRSNLSPEDARDLFRCSVNYVEIECFSYCNRKCGFCPNASIPQRQDKAGNRFMPEELYLRILDDLASIDYRGKVQFGRYNEPFAERIILDRIRQARERLPKGWLYSHTNGDFLTPGYLSEIRDVGLDEVAVQVYLGNGQPYVEEAMILRRRMILDRLGLSLAEAICAAPGLRHYHKTDFPGMLVTVDARNFSQIGTDRGGLVQIQQRPRVAPCLIPFSSLYVDWNGSVVPCCNIRSDVPEHSPYVVSRIQDGSSIFDAFAALHGWRLGLMRFGEKSGPCATCRYGEADVGAESAEGLERIWSMAKNLAAEIQST
jgi:MoaA/NifB/PqqE/SkfB family radical SAM enzyme